MVISRAEGSHVWDGAGKRYLDFTSQLVFTNLGHQHPRIVAAIREQAATLCTVAPAFANGTRSEAARLIASHTPGDLDHVFFTNGGADANEHAVRMARLHTGRHKVLTTYRSYHGGTHLAVNMTGDPRRWASDQGSTGTVHFFGPFLYRSAFHATTEAEECQRALEHLEQVVALEGPATIAAIVLEPVLGWTNHHSIVEFQGKWYLFYHDSQLSGGQTHLRNIKMVELVHRPDGSIVTIDAYRE